MSDFENSLKLAESGNPIEQFRVGIHYYYGTSVTKDLKKAVKWFKASAEQGYIYAETSLGICYRKGEGILTNYIEAVKLFQHPCYILRSVSKILVQLLFLQLSQVFLLAVPRAPMCFQSWRYAFPAVEYIF